MVSGNPKKLRDANVRQLLDLLRRHSPCSRADLVRLSGLTAPAVSSSIRTLQRQKLATFVGPEAPSDEGRPPRVLEFNARHGYVIGADIGGSTVRLALADLSGAIVGHSSAGLRSNRSPEAVTSIIAAGIQQLSRDHKVTEKKILAIAAGAPGITDVNAGRVLSAPNLTSWHDVPLRDLLQDKTGIPTIVENDVNLAALGESWRGAARDVANFVFLAIGTGAGAGVVLDGRLHHGATWSAGEVGYMMLPGLSSEAPAHLRVGALESVIGGRPIEQAWAELDGAAASGKKLTATAIFNLAAEGNDRAREVLSRTAGFLAMAITNLSLVLDLSLVVLGGGVGSHPALVESTRRALERNEFARPHVVVSRLGPAAQIYGAIWLALQAAEEHGFRRGVVRRRRTGVL